MNSLFFLRLVLKESGRKRDQFYYPVLIALFLFSAFRFEVGCDWSGYYNQFNIAGTSDFGAALEHREPIWWVLLYLLNIYELPYPVANVLSSAVFFFGVHRFALRQPDRLAFLVLLFPILIINMPMSAIRQGAAIGLMCIAFTAFLDRRVGRFVIWVFLAASFHSSALVFLLLAPVSKGRYTRNRLIFSGILAIPGAFFLAGSEPAQLAAARYVDTDKDAYGAIFRLAILALTGIYFFVILKRPWASLFPKDYSLASVGSIAMVVAGVMLPFSTVIGDRLGYYLIPIQCMIFARLPYLTFGKSAQIVAMLPYLGLIFVFTTWTYLSSHFKLCFLPYQSWLFGFPDSNGLIY